MFNVTRSGPHRLDVQLSGKLDSEAMTAALDELVEKTEGIEKGRMLFVLGEFALPTLDAIKVEFSRLPSMMGYLKKFSRCAVLADQGWIKMISEIEGAFIPGVSIRGFALAEEAEAEAWLAADSSAA